MADDGSQLFEELMRFKPDGVTPNAWAVRAGVSRTIWADLRRHGNPSRRTLSKLLEAAGSSLAEFEALRIGAPTQALTAGAGLAEQGQAWRQATLPPLPLLQSVQRGTWRDADRGIPLISIDRHKVVDLLARPPSLAADRDAYAVLVISGSMRPRFRLGRRVAVSPSSPVGVGDDVLVLLASSQDALIGELQWRSAQAIKLLQFNPTTEFEIPIASFSVIHKVVGELI